MGLSVDRRRSLTHGPHAVLDLQLVLPLQVWFDVYLFPPCTHHVRSDTRTLAYKQLDGRSFWGIAFFIYCWCICALLLLLEQPNTIIPDFYLQPTQILQPSEVGDNDSKPINLFTRGRLPVPTLEQAVPSRSGHGQLSRF